MTTNMTVLSQYGIGNITLAELVAVDYSFSEFSALLKPLLLLLAGITIYALFIFKFYKFLARRDILKLHMHKYQGGLGGFLKYEFSLLLYVIENIILIPIAVFFWFIVLTSLLMILGKNHSPSSLVLTAMAIVGAIRIAAYISEDLSRDLAKMIPFALLGVFIIDTSYFSLEYSLEVLKQLPALWKNLIYYLFFAVILEFILHICKWIVNLFVGDKKKENEKAIPSLPEQ